MSNTDVIEPETDMENSLPQAPTSLFHMTPEQRAEAVRKAETAGQVEWDGARYLKDSRGALVPVKSIREEDLLEDEIVRRGLFFAKDMAAQLSRLKGHTYEDLGIHDALLEEKKKAPRGGKKGNRTFSTFDGNQKIEIRKSNVQEFGPQLQIAKQFFDEFVRSKSGGIDDENLKTLIFDAFRVDQEGNINKSELFRLFRRNIDDPLWTQGIQALQEAIRVIGTKTHMYFKFRDGPEDEWVTVTIDLGKA
ncbi:conserved hypothetical protein [Roseibium sp. TrichSKD4]|uniref:DUF3164 family protein n=1 Tax=Roseibium sp. TrichSKD4 TaxID=744980 RepID=UPI0001E57619|nr:DUF3164 family protein [Roseibium sp. TrichSKD4]EFO30960.1 conserved hypothetical protein [Roseibium sp. TrichSKD4]